MRRASALAYAVAVLAVAAAAYVAAFAAFALPGAAAPQAAPTRAELPLRRVGGALPPASPVISVVQRSANIQSDVPGNGAGSLGSAVRTAVAVAFCAFACSAASRSGAQKRLSVVMRRMTPTQGKKRQKTLRRLEPFGQIPAWTRKKLLRRRVVQPWRQRPPRRPSTWGRQFIEKQRIRHHFNIKDYQLSKYMREAFKSGIDYPVDRAIQILESRLDNVIWRVGLAPSMTGARFLIRELHVEYKSGAMRAWRKVNKPSIRLKVGDTFRIRRNKTSTKLGRKLHDEEGPVVIPDHINYDQEEMSGTYTGPCEPNDFGLHVNEQMITVWYSGAGRYLQKALRRKHFRTFAGTNRVIKKSFNGGRIRKTPENLLNMKLGRGLRMMGRKRPPSLWGRKKPLNDAYEIGSRVKA